VETQTNSENVHDVAADSDNGEIELTVTEVDIQAFIQKQKNTQEEKYAEAAVIIGQRANILSSDGREWKLTTEGISIAHTGNFRRIGDWQAIMKNTVDELNMVVPEETEETAYEEGEVTAIEHMEEGAFTEGGVETMDNVHFGHDMLEPLNMSDLLPDQ